MFGRNFPDTGSHATWAGALTGLLLALAMFFLSLPAQAGAGTALHVTVSYGLAAEDYQRAFSGRFVKLTAGTGQGLTGKDLGNVTAGVVVFMDPVTSDNPRTASDLIADLTGRIASNIAGMTTSMVAAMQSQNAATGVLEWKQDVLLPNSQREVLAWRMMVDSGGSARYGTPEVLPAEVLTLDVVYTPLALSAILPPSWPRYADAGLLKWRLIDRNGTARTAWTTVDAAGAFDDPESTATENVDPDAGLKCLILDRTRCGGPTDIKTLMDQQGAAGAYVAYTRRLTPLYDNVADPARPGEFIQQPRISLTIDNRELRYNGCGQALTYRNQGAYGYTLAAHAEKYLVDATLRYYPVDWSDEARTSPTESYDKSVSVPRSDIASVGATIITPGNSGSALVNVGDVAGITYLAPIVQSGQANEGILYIAASSFGWHSKGLTAIALCDEETATLKFIVAGISYAGGGQYGGSDGYREFATFTPGTAGNSNFTGNGEDYPLTGTAHFDGNNTIIVTQWLTAGTGNVFLPFYFPVVLQNLPGGLGVSW